MGPGAQSNHLPLLASKGSRVGAGASHRAICLLTQGKYCVCLLGEEAASPVRSAGPAAAGMGAGDKGSAATSSGVSEAEEVAVQFKLCLVLTR